MSVHLFQHWITDICKRTSPGYASIIYKKVCTDSHTESWAKYFIDGFALHHTH